MFCGAKSIPSGDVQSPTALIAQPDAVVLDLPTESGESAIRALHARVAKLPAVKDAPLLLFDLLERTALTSVCIADDVAMPHARTAAVDRLVLAIGRAPAPLKFDAEHPDIRLVFLVGTPKQGVTEYLQLVAAISRLLKNLPVRAALVAAATEAEFRAVLASGTQR